MVQQLLKGGGSGKGIGVIAKPAGARPISIGLAVGLGKGLAEPCDPYRTAMVFGVDLNDVNADGWNCPPNVVDETNHYDLSVLTPPCEVVVCSATFYNVPSGSHHDVGITWYRERDFKLLYDFQYQIPDSSGYGYDAWEWYYVYSYIGYVEWEIWENGMYHADVFYDGTRHDQIIFDIVGVPDVPPNYSLPTFLNTPNEAAPGTVIDWELDVTNTYIEGYDCFVMFDIDGYVWDGGIKWVPLGGSTRWFPTSPFVMPNHNVLFYAEIYCFIGEMWILDVRLSRQIQVVTVPTCTVDVIIDPSGAGYVIKDPDLTEYPQNSTVTLTAYSYEGWEFDHWQWDSVDGGTGPSIAITIGADIVVYAYFREVEPTVQGTITEATISIGGGSYIDFLSSPPDIEMGSSGRMRVVGRNDTIWNENVWFDILIYEPDVSEPLPPPTYNFIQSLGTAIPPGYERVYLAPSFNINKPGEWKCWIRMYMNVTIPEVVDEIYLTTLCTVAGEVEVTELLNVIEDGTYIETEIISGIGEEEEHYLEIQYDGSISISTYIASERNNDFAFDSFKIEASLSGSGNINFVKIVAFCRTYDTTGNASLVLGVLNGIFPEVEIDDPTPWISDIFQLTSMFSAYTYQWDENPMTENPWTWDEVNDLQVAIGLMGKQGGIGGIAFCYQVYFEVSYTPGEPQTGSQFRYFEVDEYTNP